MPNLYNVTAEPAAPSPPLENDARTEVAVVGAGFTGLSTALHLALAGVAVMVLEANEPGFGASGRNGGQVNAGLKHDPEVVERHFGKDLGGRMNALAGNAPQFVFELIDRHGIVCEARRNGTMKAAVRQKHVRHLEATAEQLRRRGAPVEVLQGAALERATGTSRYFAAMLDRRGGDVNPLGLVRGLARIALTRGAAVYGSTRVTRLQRRGERWELQTPGGCVSAERVVLATNGYTDDVYPALRRTIVPVFGAIAASEVLSSALAQAVMPSRAVLYESGAITVYYRVDAAGRLLIGGRGPMREIFEPASIPHLLAHARLLWPGLRDVQWTHAWGGRLAMTRDQYPHLHEPAPGIIACLGYNGRGVAMATTMGKLIAQRILEPNKPSDMPVTTLKTIALHRGWPLAVRAAIARGRLTDFLG